MSEPITITTPLRWFKGHEECINAVAVFPDKRRMVTGSDDNTLRLWDKIEAHSMNLISSLDFSPDGTVLATAESGCYQTMTKLWNTKTWELQGDPIECGDYVKYCVRYSPSGELLAIATESHIEICNSGTRKRVAKFKGHKSLTLSLAWTLDGTRLLTGGDREDPTIREWDTTS